MQSFEFNMILLILYLIGQLLKWFRPMVCWSPAIERSEMRCHCYSWCVLKMMRNWLTEYYDRTKVRSEGRIWRCHWDEGQQGTGAKTYRGNVYGVHCLCPCWGLVVCRGIIKDTLPPTDISKYTFSTPYITLV